MYTVFEAAAQVTPNFYYLQGNPLNGGCTQYWRPQRKSYIYSNQPKFFLLQMNPLHSGRTQSCMPQRKYYPIHIEFLLSAGEPPARRMYIVIVAAAQRLTRRPSWEEFRIVLLSAGEPPARRMYTVWGGRSADDIRPLHGGCTHCGWPQR
jgi:hypothetical protein